MLSPAVLKAYLNRLTNLSSRNRSLLLTNLPAEQFLDLHETDFLDNKPSFDLIRQLIARRPSIPVCDVLDPRLERVNEVSKRLRKIARTERFIENERGAKDLYVGYPFVRGKLVDGTVIHAPLVFFPVHIEQQANKWMLVRRADEPITLNRSFLLAYAFYTQLHVSDEWLEQTLDEFDKDATAFRTQLYELLKSSPLEIHFNQDLFIDSLQWFTKLKKSDLDTLEHIGQLKLYPEAVLGIFPQAGSYLVPDYEALLAEGVGQEQLDGSVWSKSAPLARSLNHAILRPIREENIHTPLPLDASQEEAIRRVKLGESVVVQGPPGTGKSQLICNLMADFAAQGKRVLLVCQKRAALDVVYERLRTVGMESFSALIHDVKNDRKALYDQLAIQIEQVEEHRRLNHTLDAILLERTFDQESRRIDQAVSELQAFKMALFDESEAGVSVKQLYLTSNPTRSGIFLHDMYTHFRLDIVEEFARKLQRYRHYLARLGFNHPWANRVSFASFSFSRLSSIQQIISDSPSRIRAVQEQFHQLIGRSCSLEEIRSLIDQSCPLSALLTCLGAWEKEGEVVLEWRWQWIQVLRQQPNHPLYRIEPITWEQWERDLTASLGGSGIEHTIGLAELPVVAQQLEEAIQAQSSFLNRIIWNWFSKDKAALQRLAAANCLVLSETTLRLILEKVQKRIQFEQLSQSIERGLIGLPRSADFATGIFTPETIRTTIKVARQAIEWAPQLDNVSWVTELPDDRFVSYTVFVETIRQLIQQGRVIADWLNQVSSFLNQDQLAKLWSDPDWALTLSRSLEQDIDLLIETDQLKESLTEPERIVLDRLEDDPAPERFLNSLRLAWIEHIETRFPILRGVSSLKINLLEDELRESIRRKQALSQQILLLKLREKTYKNVTFNRLNNQITYRELKHQVTKKRHSWPVRKLIEHFLDDVFQLIPCWMASPESVSAIFPMTANLFDLVIFDEASQCFAENGIPAMYRARQLVITGDTKQLPPSDLYRIRFESESDSETPFALEVESLLDLASHYFPQTQLRGHYRSRSIDLIDFSNRLFYQNSLFLLPDFHQLNRNEPAIRYLNVKGIWKNQTNEAEARAVVELISRLQEEDPEHSIGVVTFNFQQQQLIQEVLEKSTSLFIDEKPPLLIRNGHQEPLFVKNIENVQGDERDIIIFSVGYAPDERGRLTVQFGSLNAKGGENRLNVAVTRARERVYVITSIWPEQLQVEHTTNEGPKALKKYLAYARSVADSSYRPQPRRFSRLMGGQLLKDRLVDLEQGLVEELPFADLTRKDGNQYTELILTDDELYCESHPKEAHATLPYAFELKNWPYKRIYSREFWRNQTDSYKPS